MENKYIALVYAEDMIDCLKDANILGTYKGMYVDGNGRYSEMEFYQVGFDYKTWKQLKLNRVDIDYLDDLNNLYSLQHGRCNNRNVVVKIKDMIAAELKHAEVIREQIAIRDKLVASNGDGGIVEYVSKKTSAVANNKAMSLVAYNTENELVMPFREIIEGEGSLPILVYLHDECSRGTTNTTMLLKECKSLIAALKASGQQYILVIPNVVTSYALRKDVNGVAKFVPSSYTKFIREIVDYEIKEHGGDAERVYIMGSGTGVADLMNVVELDNNTYAAACLAFGYGECDSIKKFAPLHYEVASASMDMQFEAKAISGLVRDLKVVGADVNYAEMDGTREKCMKAFYAKPAWIEGLFNCTKKTSQNPIAANDAE